MMSGLLDFAKAVFERNKKRGLRVFTEKNNRDEDFFPTKKGGTKTFFQKK